MDTGNDPGNDPGNGNDTGSSNGNDTYSGNGNGTYSGTGTDTKRMNDRELFELGITRTTINIYHVGPYKYSKLKDALEEVMRNNTKKKDTDF